MNLKIILVVSITSIAFYSCDCNQNVSGTILDKTTKQPIDRAYTQNANKNNDHNYSDKNGHFELQSISGGFRGCPPMDVAITKGGYEIVTIEIENGHHDTIYLERIK
ncbi:MAG: hypothetical protein Q8K92_24015 [Leadbetterella sp.]|nr:hypothetical protein [Leadbetterella sp.]